MEQPNKVYKADTDITQDYLKEDPPLARQDWVVISFVAPEDKVVLRNMHYANRFLVGDINQTISAQALQMSKYLNSKIRNQMDDVLERLKSSVDEDDQRTYAILNAQLQKLELDEEEFVDECRRQYELDDSEILDRYKMFLAQNRQQMDREFDDSHDNMTSTRGLKIRGCFERMEDARERARWATQEHEPAVHSFVAPVGVWFPMDVDADEVQDQEYMLPQLNELMKKYHDNMHNRNQHINKRQEEALEHARKTKGMSTRQRLQQKLRKKRNEKMRREMEEVAQAGREPEVGVSIEQNKSIDQVLEELEPSNQAPSKPKPKSKPKRSKRARRH